MADLVTCVRCGRDAPTQLDGTSDDPDWSAWEVTDGGDNVICPGCLTGADEQAIADSFLDLDPLHQIPFLVKEFEEHRIGGGDFENGLAEQRLLVEALYESGSSDAEEARRILADACAKLPPESIGDTLAKVYRVLDKLPRELDDEETS